MIYIVLEHTDRLQNQEQEELVSRQQHLQVMTMLPVITLLLVITMLVSFGRSFRAILRKRSLKLLESHRKGMKTDTSSSSCVRKSVPISAKWLSESMFFDSTGPSILQS